MPGEDKQTTQQTQQSVSNPWGPTQGTLQDIISKYSGQNTDVTGAQSGAATNLQTAANSIPNLGPEATDAILKMFNSSTAPQAGMLQDAWGNLNKNLGATASGAELNPMSTPGFSDALKTMTDNITNATKGVYAGSGRDPSGAGSFAQSLGRGLTQGIAPVIQSQFNQNKANQMNAASTLFGGESGTAGNITSQNQVPLTNAMQALGVSPMLSSIFTSPGAAQLGAANTSYGLPFQNLGMLSNPISQIASLGGQTSGTGTSTTTQPQSTMSNIMGGISGGLGLLSFMSDENSKENIEQVGKLNDGQDVIRFNYKGDPRTQIGLSAQKVHKVAPHAVSRHPKIGMLMVDYAKATEHAANMRKAA